MRCIMGREDPYTAVHNIKSKWHNPISCDMLGNSYDPYIAIRIEHLTFMELPIVFKIVAMGNRVICCVTTEIQKNGFKEIWNTSLLEGWSLWKRKDRQEWGIGTERPFSL